MGKDLDIIHMKSVQEIDEKLETQMRHRLGHGIFISQKPDSKQAYGVVGLCIPEIIDDSKTNKRIVKVLKFDSIGTFEIKKEREEYDVLLPRFAELYKNVTMRTNILIANVETSLLEKTYEQLLQIPSIQNAVTPMRVILNDIRTRNEFNFNEFKRERGAKKAIQYMEFLKDLDLIRIENGKIVGGNQFIEFEKDLKSKGGKEMFDRLLAYILKNGLPYINEYLHLTSIKPYIKWVASYYFPSAEAGKLLSLNRLGLIQNFANIYNMGVLPPHSTASNQIGYLVDYAKIFDEESGYLIGNEDVLKNVSQKIGI
ncbi:MAG: hypothetical protein M1160_03570 [Candidatus Marsarchaeota archaeon]|jgi:hypothetical protein|nr:hypothetical protein [Candidatus Marsarchaeota archaeon]MCL5111923.1 hypothetical protein [Candidatus Marsarchaeota archaeon]